jgi:hypothetical protein
MSYYGDICLNMEGFVLLNGKSCRFVLALCNNHAQQKAIQSLCKIYIFGF